MIRAVEHAAHDLNSEKQIHLLGPSPALIERSHWGFHWKLILKSEKEHDPDGLILRRAAERIIRDHRAPKVTLRVDTDPYQLL